MQGVNAGAEIHRLPGVKARHGWRPGELQLADQPLYRSGPRLRGFGAPENGGGRRRAYASTASACRRWLFLSGWRSVRRWVLTRTAVLVGVTKKPYEISTGPGGPGGPGGFGNPLNCADPRPAARRAITPFSSFFIMKKHPDHPDHPDHCKRACILSGPGAARAPGPPGPDYSGAGRRVAAVYAARASSHVPSV